MSKQSYIGRCLCGAVCYSVNGRLRDVVNCHCGQCRRTHGHYAAYTAARHANLSLTEQRGLKWYQSSAHACRRQVRMATNISFRLRRHSSESWNPVVYTSHSPCLLQAGLGRE